MMTGPPRRSQGFSLLEMMVAVAIMALALGMFYRALGGSARTVADTTHYAEALVLAESILQSRDSVPSAGWRDSGVWQEYRWAIGSAVYVSQNAVAPVLHRVQVDVRWSDGSREGRVSLVSLLPERS